jgi:hypothetical protein
MSNLTKEILQGKFEKTEKDGEIYLPQAKVFIGGAFEYWLNDEEHYADGNIVVNEGLDHLLDVTLSNGTQKANWFVSIFKANYTPVSTDTAQNISTNSTEVVGSGDVAETARQAWVEPGVSSQSLTNTASPAVFTATGTLTAYGAFLISTSAYGNGISSDKLLAASAFSAPRSMIATDILNVTYTLNVADA